MIINFFKGLTENLKYYVGINQIEVDPEELSLEKLLKLIEVIQKNHKDTVLQFFNEKYVLNKEHIFHACYFVQNAFFNKTNISNKKNIEFFLYLAAKRQIKLGLEDFGIDNYNINNRRISFCVISSKNNIKQINLEVNKYLGSKDMSLNLEETSIEKYKIVKNYFNFSNKQILTVLKSYGIKMNYIEPNEKNIVNLFRALNDLVCEEMALLSLEKRRSN